VVREQIVNWPIELVFTSQLPARFLAHKAISSRHKTATDFNEESAFSLNTLFKPSPSMKYGSVESSHAL